LIEKYEKCAIFAVMFDMRVIANVGNE